MGCGSSNEVVTSGVNFKELSQKSGMDIPFIKNMLKLYQAIGGKMAVGHFIDIYSRVNKTLDASQLAEFLTRVFNTYDTDKSGTMDFEEFIMMVSSICTGSLAKKITLVFKLCDDDNSGSIEKTEFLATIKSLKFVIKPGDFDKVMNIAENVFDAVDADGNGHMTLTEFLEGFAVNDNCVSLFRMVFSGIVQVLTFGSLTTEVVVE